MEITLNSGERIAFTWRGDGQLFVALVGEATGAWDDPKKQFPVRSSATLTGAELVDFLESFMMPLFRRALAIAVEFPQEKARNKQ